MSEILEGVSPKALLKKAKGALSKSYSPYSGFPVAAAVVDERGRVFTGVNIENASLGLTICAERVAVFSAVASGAKSICAVAISAAKSHPICPCGACRQVLLEFGSSETPVYSDLGDGTYITWTVAGLIPNAFTKSELSEKLDGPQGA